MIGPTTGIHAYPQSEEPLPGIGKIACAIRGARSRAGLIAKPVVPPRLNPIEMISSPTMIGFSPCVNSLVPMKSNASTNTEVARISLNKFENVLPGKYYFHHPFSGLGIETTTTLFCLYTGFRKCLKVSVFEYVPVIRYVKAHFSSRTTLSESGNIQYTKNGIHSDQRFFLSQNGG